MAELFLALQEGVGGFSKIVALKRILPHLSDAPDFVSMFLDEAKLAARLDHPNIVRIYDLGSIEGQYYLAMEYLPGEDLSLVARVNKRRQRTIDPDIAATMICSAAEGLHYAHGMTDATGRPVSLVHRDVTPANILVTYHGNVKLVDFGIAKASVNSSTTEVGNFKGKIAYLAPEQIAGEPADRRSDVFSLAIVFWELLVGKRLFGGDSDVSTLRAISSGPIRPPSEFRRDIPPRLEAILMKALSRNPAERFQTAGEMADALEGYFHTRGRRPSSGALARWLTDLFGERRAQAKLQIAKGSNLKAAVSEVMREVTSDSGTPSTTPNVDRSSNIAAMAKHEEEEETTNPGLPPAYRSALLMGFLLFTGAALWGGQMLFSRKDVSSPASVRATAGSLTLQSSPEGAAVFVAGEPTGKMTPVVLHDVPFDRPIEVRLERPGYHPAEQSIRLTAGEEGFRQVVLKPKPARLFLQNVPPRAEVEVDGEVRAGFGPFELNPGNHSIRLWLDGKVYQSRTLEVTLGDQSLRF
jgi:serine/threonine-protein kinase